MNGPGKILQQARKKKRYSIEKIHKATKIKKEYLEGLENDNVSAFPAELYYKNFLKTYAKYLALDPTELVNLYEQTKLEQQEDLFKQSNTNNIENKFVEFYKKNKQTIFYIGYGLIAVIIVYIIVLLIPTKQDTVPEETNKKPAITKQENKVAVSTTPQQTEQKLYIKAIDDTWIKVIGDDRKLFESILTKDKTFEATTKKEFNIKIGNIDGIEVYFNDKPVDISKGASNSKVNTITMKRD